MYLCLHLNFLVQEIDYLFTLHIVQTITLLFMSTFAAQYLTVHMLIQINCLLFHVCSLLQGTTVVYPLSNTGLLHTGRGFAQIGSGEGVQFTLSVEMSSTYEVTVRYWVSMATLCVPIYVCVMYTHTHARMHTHTHTHTHTCAYTVHTHAHTSTEICIQKYTHSTYKLCTLTCNVTVHTHLVQLCLNCACRQQIQRLL